jgi:hypothetical protein
LSGDSSIQICIIEVGRGIEASSRGGEDVPAAPILVVELGELVDSQWKRIRPVPSKSLQRGNLIVLYVL